MVIKIQVRKREPIFSAPTGLDSVSEFDVYMSGDRYRRARYEQAKRQERLLEEQNRLLRENQHILKNKK